MYKLLKQILKELQAIRSYLEPKEINLNDVVSQSVDEALCPEAPHCHNVTLEFDSKTIYNTEEIVKNAVLASLNPQDIEEQH